MYNIIFFTFQSMLRFVLYYTAYLLNRYIPVDAYARLSAKCSIEGLERSIIKVVWCQLEIRLGILLLLSFVPHGMYGTPQIKLPTKSSLQHTLGLQTRARNLNKNYCVPTEDVKLLRRNLRACLQQVTSS